MRCVSAGTKHSFWLPFPENSLASVPRPLLPTRTHEAIQDEARVKPVLTSGSFTFGMAWARLLILEVISLNHWKSGI